MITLQQLLRSYAGRESLPSEDDQSHEPESSILDPDIECSSEKSLIDAFDRLEEESYEEEGEKENESANKEPSVIDQKENTQPAWDQQTKQYIDWFICTELPIEDFELAPGTRVLDPAKFYSAIRSQIETGPSLGRALTATLAENLRLLHKRFGKEQIRPRVHEG